MEPAVESWAAPLSACPVHCIVELAELAATYALESKPKYLGVYVSLSNIYGKERRWEYAVKGEGCIEAEWT